jgi:hypothetical protein
VIMMALHLISGPESSEQVEKKGTHKSPARVRRGRDST